MVKVKLDGCPAEGVLRLHALTVKNNNNKTSKTFFKLKLNIKIIVYEAVFKKHCVLIFIYYDILN
jgi:hypothetical protein